MSAARAVLPSAVAALAVSSSAQADDELLAVAMSDGRLAVLRSCEEDLWEETLEVGFVRACVRLCVHDVCVCVCVCVCVWSGGGLRVCAY